MIGVNAEIGEKGKLFIQSSFSFLPQESKFSNQNSYHRGPFLLTPNRHIAQGRNSFQLVHISTAQDRQDFHVV